jgi:predicted DNA-binding transcriptional regulator AlpA
MAGDVRHLPVQVPTLDALERDPLAAARVPIADVPGLLVAVTARLAQLDAARAVLAARLASGGVETTPAADRLLAVPEAAERCGLSPDWLYRHAATLPFARRIGRTLRFSEAGLVRWMETRPR